ncbi:fkbp-type peptidyl-prolyl cis-trans isomerase [Grosmannia clavigera kw1407]|uniref:peptidylprolyl isomerase n=1 Tax=Grosmannia clavigera (strain kw1407 / UAMH 11150) TaxID=655863 RepID=F0XEZ8_GROCL|nr:fkbp-type peptidyl-prolyl cis-trans isomerase [Grosmannia clavigera kw1407]EFX04424.1 fkbp-type peptidyl-prolyl cis-trans isomerase [Grosmannia clavigera kw1407]
MSQPQGVFGLEVPPGGVLIPAVLNFPATIAISMAAIDPTAEPEADEEGNIPTTGRSTLRIVRRPIDDESDDEDEEDEYLRSILAGSDDDDDEDDDEPNGGPSDPSKSPRRKDIKALLDALAAENGDDDEDEDEDEEMEDVGATKGKKKASSAKVSKPSKTSKKGKEPATVEDDEDDEDEDEDDEDDEDDSDDEDVVLEDFVLCTLDTERLYQQPLQIEINAGETVFFTVTGSHAVHLTGNYIVEDDEDSEDEDDEDDDDYDLPPDIDLEELDSEDEDELDELDLITGRVEEVDDDEVAPKLTEVKKGGKKRPAEDVAEQTLDDLISKEAKGAETKLSKKQQKKLKNNQGEAVGVQKQEDEKKRVQFAKNLEQGPTGSGAKDAKDAKDTKGKTALGVKVVQGVTIDDRKLGSGRIVKSGDRVGMRYIGKLENGKVFDSNKKGPAFSFRVGKGEVIRGWDIGIAGMAIGGERRLTIPAHLAYGSKKLDGIPANSTLIFDVKLLEIK